MKLRTLKLGEICEITGGFGFPHFFQGRRNEKYPFYKVSDMNTEGNEVYMLAHNHSISVDDVKKLKVKIYPTGAIIFPKIGAAIATNKKRILSTPSTVDNNVMALIPSRDIDTKYLFFFLQNFDLKDWANKASLPSIRKSDVESTEFVVPFNNGKPDIAEQKRIANDLDKILYLQKHTFADVERVENLFNSILRDFFANKIRNVQKIKLGNECDVIKGHSPTLKTPEGDYPFVVTAGKRRTANSFQFNDEAVCIPLVSSTGHGHASLHRIHYEKGKFALANILAGVVPKDKNKLATKYLYYYLLFYKNELLVPLMRGVANVTIPISKLNDVLIDVPKIDEQRRLVDTLENAEKLKQIFLRRQNLVQGYLKSSLNLAFSET